MSDTVSTPNWADVLALVAQLDASGLEEAEIVADGVSVRVSRTPGAWGAAASAAPAVAAAPVVAPTPAAPTSGATTPEATASPPPAAPAPPVRTDLLEVTAPMLGVVYLRPAPDQGPFVTVGDTVAPDTTVAIVEVMKLMNPVTAGVSGRVVEIVVDEGAMVEFGAVLLRVEPS